MASVKEALDGWEPGWWGTREEKSVHDHSQHADVTAAEDIAHQR